jgi:hypothetical protein
MSKVPRSACSRSTSKVIIPSPNSRESTAATPRLPRHPRGGHALPFAFRPREKDYGHALVRTPVLRVKAEPLRYSPLLATSIPSRRADGERQCRGLTRTADVARSIPANPQRPRRPPQGITRPRRAGDYSDRSKACVRSIHNSAVFRRTRNSARPASARALSAPVAHCGPPTAIGGIIAALSRRMP